MTKYQISLVNVGSWVVEVEADSEDEAINAAFEMAPTENIHTGFDLGEWCFASDLWPSSEKADEVQVIE